MSLNVDLLPGEGVWCIYSEKRICRKKMTYLHVGSRVPVLNKCWKAGTGVLIAKRSQRKSIFPKEQSDQEMKGFPRRPESKEGGGIWNKQCFVL